MCCGDGELFVSQLHKAYVDLAITAANEDGSRTVSIRRFSALEVRLVELATRQTLDCLCHVLCEAERSTFSPLLDI